MSFQALYRKYRPQRFGELVGQEHITTALRNAVRDGRVGHAYLFSGRAATARPPRRGSSPRRSTVSTSEPTASRAVSARTACAIAAGTFGDLIEIDAASNRGVDDARDLVSRINLGLGATSKRKVYMLDEVHMLTQGRVEHAAEDARGAPAARGVHARHHRPEKVLPTIRSRTQHFEFTYLTVDEIERSLASVLADEGVDVEPEALP